MNALPITEADLHAYVDGLLPLARQAEIEAWLAARPEEAARIAAYRSQNLALRQLFDPVLDEAVPPAIRLPLPLPLHRPWWNGPARRYAAAVLIALLGGVAGWAVRDGMAPPAVAGSGQARVAGAGPGTAGPATGLARQAAIAHVVYSPEVRHPVEVGAEQEAHLVAWLSKRLGKPVHPPHLGKLGYDLIGGRLLPGQRGPVAQFMYQDVAGKRLTLYVSTEQAAAADTGFRFAQEGKVGVFYWIDGDFGYALSASAGRGELAAIATAVHAQLE
jgi:anti-sigma factor RsiW